MPRKKKISDLVLLPTTGLRRIAGREIRFERIYQVPALKPDQRRGPWSEEADKLAWTDPSGFSCIILRKPHHGHLCGFVGVEPGHPLFGVMHDAIPHTLNIRVHGGLNYSEPCDERGPEARRVCHVREQMGEAHDLRWWFGFSCDQPYDLVPGREGMAEPEMSADLSYRDEAYLFDQCTGLAAQLAAIGVGMSPESVPIVEPPAIGSDRLRAKE